MKKFQAFLEERSHNDLDCFLIDGFIDLYKETKIHDDKPFTYVKSVFVAGQLYQLRMSITEIEK